MEDAAHAVKDAIESLDHVKQGGGAEVESQQAGLEAEEGDGEGSSGRGSGGGGGGGNTPIDVVVEEGVHEVVH